MNFYPNGAVVCDGAAIGEETILGINCIIHGTVVIGKNCRIGDGAILMDHVIIGDNTLIGSGSIIEKHVRIGKHVSIQTQVNITARSVVEDGVFVGPGVKTANDRYMAMGDREQRLKEQKGPTLLMGCRIGLGALLGPGVVIGEGAVVGMGSVIRHDVPPEELWAGNPAKFIRKVGVGKP